MRSVYTTLLILLAGSGLFAQRINDCGTKDPLRAIKPDNERARIMATETSFPLLMKVFVHVIADDSGNNVAAGDSSVMRQMENMRQFFAAHNICFILAGYEQINNTDLNNHNVDTESSELVPFLIPGLMNIFIHKSLSGNDGNLNGNAYNIPNFFLSVVGSAIQSLTNLSTTAHEMGHCFGLYHTFRSTNNGNTTENVARSGTCKNCEDEGDLLCDTPADREVDETVISQTNCVYTGNMVDDCNVPLQMAPTNIMTYGRRSCRNNFTTGQGIRATSFILSTSYLSDAIAPDVLNIGFNANVSSGRFFALARNSVSINTGSFNISGPALANMNSTVVTLNPGVTLTPSGSGYTHVRTNNLCQ
jgi:hypothetical protein